jgi:peptidoglycan/LPS O-acetylase OafA/YrhL
VDEAPENTARRSQESFWNEGPDPSEPLPPAVDSLGHGGVAVAERTDSGSPPRAAPTRKVVTVGRARPRLYVIDGIRLVAALMVAVHHYAGTNRANQPGNAIWDRPASEIMPTLFHFASFGWIGVEIFFVISGFVICMSCWGRTPKDFFVSRVIRLYPAYWVGVAFTTVSMIVLPGVWRRPPGRDILLNFTMLQSGSNVPDVDIVYWTLWSELRFYLLFMVVVAMGLTHAARSRAWPGVLVVMLTRSLPLTSASPRTSSTEPSSSRHTTTSSLAATASRTVAAAFAPSPTSGLGPARGAVPHRHPVPRVQPRTSDRGAHRAKSEHGDLLCVMSHAAQARR